MFIGIAGPSASGKTTLAKRLHEQFVTDGISCQIISIDDYYHNCSHLSEAKRRNRNFDHPGAIDFQLLRKHLKKYISGKEIQKIRYSHVDGSRKIKGIIAPAQVVILEGIYALFDPKITAKMDLKIFVDAELGECLRRRIRRAAKEPDRKKSIKRIVEQYEKFVAPMYHKFIEPTKQRADLIIDGGNKNGKI